MRLFIAIRFNREVKDALIRAIEDLRGRVVSGSFTRPENLHLTLVFIGESDDVKTIRAVIDECGVPPFDMAVAGSGNFGDLYWAGVENSPELSGLVVSLREKLRSAGFDIDEKPFRPHITLARRVQPRSHIRVNMQRATMTVKRISLMKSERINGKLTYTEIYGRDL